MKEFDRSLEEFWEARMANIKDSFESSITPVFDLFRSHSIIDVAESLFISSMWLPNIASPVKYQLATTIFASMKPQEFAAVDTINSYEDFQGFVERLSERLPSVENLEDFVPEPDWGSIRFHHDGKNYKMFFGNELSNVYDYLTLFQMLYIPYDKGYIKYADRSPRNELRCCLELQQGIIEGIGPQPKMEDIEGLSPGHLEIPSKEFWSNTRSFYSAFSPERIIPKPVAKEYSIKLGAEPKESLSWDGFGEKVLTGTLVQAFFVEHASRLFPILPRRYSGILFDKWSLVFHENVGKIESKKGKYALRMGGQLYRYVKSRLMTDSVFPLACTISGEGRPSKIVFPVVFISKDRLVMLYLTEPTLDSKKAQKELEGTVQDLNEALNMVSNPPVTLGLRLSNEKVRFEPKSEGRALKPELITLIPQVSTQAFPILIPETFPGRLMFIDSFLGIVDLLDNDEEFAEFLSYLDSMEKRIQPGLTMLDKFASFKDSLGVLVSGALRPDFMMLDPHWGAHFRHKSLAEFWGIYPEIDFFDHPRTWKVTQETETRRRLEARGYFGAAIHCQIGSTNAFLTAPFNEMTFDQGRLSNLLMECLEDSMSRRSPLVCRHAFFKTFDRFQVNFFPLSLVSGNPPFNHLKHLISDEHLWCADVGMADPACYGIRLVFNTELITKAFMEVEDSTLEVDILLEVMRQLNKVISDPQIGDIAKKLEKTKKGPPRFKLFSEKKPASFPELVNPYEPKPEHFKRAKKTIAEIARELDIQEGYYELEDAKKTLNQLRGAIVAEINQEVLEYSFSHAIPFLLARIDALNAKRFRQRITAEHAVEHETDYRPEVSFVENETKVINSHRNYRYLIEKFVQLEPIGADILEEGKFQYLIALIDWLHVLYSASDNVHYGILPVGIKLDRDYLIDVVYESEMEEKDRAFAKELAQLDLYLAGNPDDRVISPRPLEEFLDELDKAWLHDLGFGFRNMLNVLRLLSFWPTHQEGGQEATSYCASQEEIAEVCTERIENLGTEEIDLIIKFLALRRNDVTRVLGQEDPCDDLPVWEHRKRYARYNLKPLLLIGNKYHWGPLSARKTGIIWSGGAPSGRMPIDIKGPSIVDVLRDEKKLIENALANKAFEIVKRYTPHARKNLRLHRLEPKGSHPDDLGDYDVLSFYPAKNILFNVECKDILPVFCLKDAKRLREKIFGRPGKGLGQFEKIVRRKDYLSKHQSEIGTALDWPMNPDLPPEIVTIYVSRQIFWWTRYPPAEIDAVFPRDDQLADFIEGACGCSLGD